MRLSDGGVKWPMTDRNGQEQGLLAGARFAAAGRPNQRGWQAQAPKVPGVGAGTAVKPRVCIDSAAGKDHVKFKALLLWIKLKTDEL